MPRIVKAYDDRYAQFLDVAQGLFYQKGYDQTSVQEIIAAMGVAKGLFYYYFRTKGDLLDAVIERMAAQTLQTLSPMLTDPTLDAQSKFLQLFGDVQSWKLANKAFMLDLMRVLYRDENVLLRTKLTAASVPMMAPLVAQIIQQGVAEGVFAVEHPMESALIVLEIGQGLSNAIVQFLLTASQQGDPVIPAEKAAALAALDRRVDAYERAIERVLGATPGSLPLVQQDDIRVRGCMWNRATAVGFPTDLNTGD